MKDHYTDSLRRIAVAMMNGIDGSVTASIDSRRLHARLEFQKQIRPEASAAEHAIEARVGFIAEVLAKSGHESFFVCPTCSGSHFGSTCEKFNGKLVVTERQCHDEFGIGCRWRGQYEEKPKPRTTSVRAGDQPRD